MRHLKRTIFALLGFAFVAGPVIGILYALKADKFGSTIGAVIGMTLIAMLIAFLICVIGAIINKLFEDSGMTIFAAFFLVSFQKRKRLYHSSMGEFELIIDEDDMKGRLVRQGFFSCSQIAMFDIEREDFMETIKKHLDSKYKDEIAKKEEKKRKQELIGKVMKQEGYLDAVAKRDDKINKLGIR